MGTEHSLLYKDVQNYRHKLFCECKQILLHIGYRDQTNISTILHDKFSNNCGNQYIIWKYIYHMSSVRKKHTIV